MRMRRKPPLSERELMIRASALAQRSVGEIAEALQWDIPRDARKAKGYVGQLIEAALGADPEAGERPDFTTLGIELKTIPMAPNGKPVESTFVCSIDMAGVDRELWEASRLRQRLLRVLWMPVTGARYAPLAERSVGLPVLWSPTDDDEAALRADWERIIGTVSIGGSITAHVGAVLQARPKAASSSVRQLSVDDDAMARTLPLGFYLRSAFTQQIIGSGREYSKALLQSAIDELTEISNE
jgi:DNA mismatch repair protein MutH